jgi:ribonucleoside-triphosphate reductase
MNSLSRNAVESPFSNVSIFDRPKLLALLKDMDFYFQDSDETQEYIVEFIIELQKIYMEFFDKGDVINGGKPFRFPVTTINLSKKEGDKVELLDKDFINYISGQDIYRYNILVSEGTKVASCCRLLSDNELFELGGQMNSFGGAGLSLGSHRVVTINFNRIALEAKSEAHYYQILEQRIEDSAKILQAHRQLIKDTAKDGLQPFITNGWLNLDRMFSTFGVIGLVEAKTTLETKFGKLSDDVIGVSLKFLNEKSREITKKTKNVFNIEQIPGETMAVKLCDVDKMLFGDQVKNELYANQFVPLWEDATIWDRMDIDGKYNKLFTGGGIVHFNLGEKTTTQQNVRLINYAAETGCEHFALNSVYSQCENGHTTFSNKETCPTCGGQIVERFTRTIGFFSPVSSWNKVRREWEFPRRKFKAVS